MDPVKPLALLAEDSQPIREAEIEFLEGKGFEVLPASDGAEAIAILGTTQRKIILVLTDFTMPKAKGDKVAAEAKEKGIPHIIIYSALPQSVPPMEGVRIIAKDDTETLKGVIKQIQAELSYKICEATAANIEQIQKLILEHGPNEWNYLPEDNVRAHVEKIKTDEVFAVVAKQGDEIIGVVTFEIGKHYPQYQPQGRENEDHGYIAEAVVSKKHARHKIGATLAKEAIKQLAAQGIKEIYAKRHEENIPSAKMMEQAGMEAIDTFPDQIRTTGSKRTTVCRIIVLD